MVTIVKDKFIEWLNNELKVRNINQRQLAINAGISPGTVSHILSGTRNPGPEFCEKVAKAFDIPVMVVLEKADILSAKVAEYDPDLIILEHLYYSLNKQDRRLLLDFAKMLKQKYLTDTKLDIDES
jgi:transcriptional regulator with XRE-family HTH domain